MPAGAATQRYWQARACTPRRRLAAIGWSMVRLSRSSRTLTFARTAAAPRPCCPAAAHRWPYHAAMPRLRGSAYQPLADYLAAQPANEVTLSFGEIEAILTRPLPASAYLPHWWTVRNANHARSQSWRSAGWDAVPGAWRGTERWVTFQRRR